MAHPDIVQARNARRDADKRLAQAMTAMQAALTAAHADLGPTGVVQPLALDAVIEAATTLRESGIDVEVCRARVDSLEES